MLKYEQVVKKPSVLRSLTGLNKGGFEQLLKPFEQAYEQDLDEREQRREKERQRARGGGRPGELKHIEDKLLFILVYFKLYPLQELIAFLFGMSQPQANEWLHRLTPVLNEAFGYEKQLPARKSKDIAAVLAQCPGLEFIIDGTERPIQRPKDKHKQREYYSGKKKRHTVKNNVITDKRTKKIKGLSPTEPGKKQDKKAADEEDYHFPEGAKLWKDTGYQGYEPEGITTFQPKKKPRGGALTEQEKEENALISSQRIGVEHAIGGVKVFHIVRDVYRNHKDGFVDLVMETACGLHNLRLDFPMAA